MGPEQSSCLSRRPMAQLGLSSRHPVGMPELRGRFGNRPGEYRQHAARRLRSYGIRRLLIVNREGGLEGILAFDDFVDLISDAVVRPRAAHRAGAEEGTRSEGVGARCQRCAYGRRYCPMSSAWASTWPRIDRSSCARVAPVRRSSFVSSAYRWK